MNGWLPFLLIYVMILRFHFLPIFLANDFSKLSQMDVHLCSIYALYLIVSQMCVLYMNTTDHLSFNFYIQKRWGQEVDVKKVEKFLKENFEWMCSLLQKTELPIKDFSGEQNPQCHLPRFAMTSSMISAMLSRLTEDKEFIYKELDNLIHKTSLMHPPSDSIFFSLFMMILQSAITCFNQQR